MITGSSSKCTNRWQEGCREFINTGKNKEANTCILELRETKYVHIFLCHTDVITISSAIYIYLYVYSKINADMELPPQLVINIMLLFMLEILNWNSAKIIEKQWHRVHMGP
jgi:hypothetical protein